MNALSSLAAANGALAARKELQRVTLAEPLRELMARECLTLAVAAERLGISRQVARNMAAQFDIRTSPLAKRAKLSANRAAQTARMERNDAAVLQLLHLNRQKWSGLSVAADQMRISWERAKRVWYAAHPGVDYKLPKAPAPKPAINAAAARAVGTVLNRLSFTAERQMTPEQKAAKYAAIAHARRTAALPPVTDDEAARLVADHISRKGVTVLPGPMLEAQTNLGAGWYGTSGRKGGAA
jgi:hypothetical protein